MSEVIKTKEGLICHEQEGLGLVVSAAEHAYVVAQLEATCQALIKAGDKLVHMDSGYCRGRNQHPAITDWDKIVAAYLIIKPL